MAQPKNESFKVFIRCRPLNEKQTSCFSNRKSVSIIEPATVSLVDIDSKQTLYNYDGVFTENSSTQEIFEQSVQPVINHFINGYNSTVFAYGITGAGKSYTMFGSEQHFGLIPLTIDSILRSLSEEKWNLKMSYIEIYNEQIFDLLVQRSDNLQVIEDPDKGVIVMDVQQRQISSFENAHQYINQGNMRRVMAQTYANDFSSRSHAIVLLTLQRQVGQKIVTAKMSLVDLAGSQKATVYTGQNKGANRLQGSNINKSLLALGNCIMILSENSKKSGFVPYRDSKLTRLLKDSLGGNTKTVMIACISQSPMCYDQTLSTLKYARRARRIEKTVVQNTKQQNIGNYQQLRAEIQKLRKQNELLKVAQTKDLFDKKSKQAKLQNLLNNLIQTIKQTTQIQNEVQQQYSKINNSRLQNYLVQRQSIIQEIIKTAIGESKSFESSQVVYRPKQKNTSVMTRDNQRSRTICKPNDQRSHFQLNSLNHVRSHRRRNSIMHSESMSNTLTFLNNFTNLQQSKVAVQPISLNRPTLMKSHSTYTIKQQPSPQQVGKRKSKHLNVLKQIQQMSKKLLVISNEKKVFQNNSIKQGVQEDYEIQNYQEDEIL